MKNIIQFAVLIFMSIWLLRTCSTSFSPELIDEENLEIKTINEIRDDIADFQYKAVLISGRVESTYYFQLFGGGFYTLSDGTAKIPVFTKNFTPEKGLVLRVVVEPKPLIRFGGTTGVTSTEIKIIRTDTQSPAIIAAKFTERVH